MTGSEPAVEIVGVVPAAGHATRLSPLPCSKEIFPIGFHSPSGDPATGPKVACHYLFDRMRAAGASKAYVVLRDRKWDIPAYFGDGALVGIPLAYVVVAVPYGPPFTVDQAYPFVRDAHVLFGFPDILFEPHDAFVELLAKQRSTGADLVLGLFPARRPEKMDMVELDSGGRVRSLAIKPQRTDLRYTWIIAVWTPVFTDFLHASLARWLQRRSTSSDSVYKEIHVGHVVEDALRSGLHVEAALFPEGTYVDIGTPEDLVTAVAAGLPSSLT